MYTIELDCFACYLYTSRFRYTRPSWAMFELGRAPVYWKTMNGLPPMAGEKLKLFYNPKATKLTPNEDFGIGFNEYHSELILVDSICCLYLSQEVSISPLCAVVNLGQCLGKLAARMTPHSIPSKYAYQSMVGATPQTMNLIFSFTNGADWDGPYRIQFEVPKAWRNKPIDFFNQGLAEELSKEGACDKAIFPDTDIVVDRCAIIANLSVEGGDRCDLNLVPGCMDTSSPLYDPLANVDDGSCLIDSDLED
ncbi:hypothetical protein Patl1_34534 [Pistacia atlantica]|uniref:Uncharacterized protein n=1 Tax=Pistacia atlantica TaxID=434234 RepID=A0ACC0ZT67_9ROSI|nr:hypothetical protein Patl1_34534 [Pistacia atlantica]